MTELHFTRLNSNGDIAPLLALYRRAINGIDQGLYSGLERQIWREWADVPGVADRLFRQGITLLATREEQLEGFGQIMPDFGINMLYVDPASGRQGVGSALIRAMEQIARHQGAPRIHTRASHASRPVFQRSGFVAAGPDSIRASTHVRVDRTIMVKDLRISRR